jgi:peptidoglycan LD-endopeptidase LytH
LIRNVFSFLIGGILCSLLLLGYLEGTGRLRPPAGAEVANVSRSRPTGQMVPVTQNAPTTQTTPSERPMSDEPVGAPPAQEPAEIEQPAPQDAATTTLAVPEQALQPILSSEIAIPVVGVKKSELRDHFNDARGGRVHHAIDIAATRGTPVIAAIDGNIAKLFLSRAGGITLYQLDDEGKLIYYYAHLDGYAPSMAVGRRLKRGEVLGYVGTTGNAPPNAPHLHFAIEQLADPKQWWKGTPINPYPILISRGVTFAAPAR